MRRTTAKADKAAIFDANRAHGRIALSVIARDGRTHRRQVDEAGSYRIRFPNVEGQEAEAVIINTAGGVAGGDEFSVSIAALSGARLSVTTAAAEKIYRAIGAPARMNVTLSAAPGTALRWLPQETILFDEARLHRNIDVECSGDASLLMAETIIFGRTAMNESVVNGELVDRWRIRRNGRLAFAETLRLTGNIGTLLARPAAGNGAVALATVVVAPGDESLVQKVRGVIGECGSEAAISAWNGLAIVRLCAGDAALLRRDLVSVLNAASGGLPRLWTS
jgi:urease accessory protein